MTTFASFLGKEIRVCDKCKKLDAWSEEEFKIIQALKLPRCRCNTIIIDDFASVRVAEANAESRMFERRTD